jgi:uncharacterized protein
LTRLTIHTALKVRARARSAARALAASILRVYRIALSPLVMALFGPACRFEPSCSEYAQFAIATHGVWRGGYMAARRVLRCRPMGGHGYDPVPGCARPLAEP